jgi:hypothetical protein
VLCVNTDYTTDLRRALVKKELNIMSSLNVVDFLTSFSGGTALRGVGDNA